MADKVTVTKSLLDNLANDINEASGESGAKTIAQMRSTVQNLSASGGYYTPAVTQDDENTMTVEFAPSAESMPSVKPVEVTLPAGPAGADGKDGYTPVKGTDYWTEEDKAEIQDADIVYLSQELAKRQQITPEYANDISGCTDTSKLYVLPDGLIYAYMLGESTGTVTETVTPTWQLGVKLDKTTGAESSGGYYTACAPIYIEDGATYVFSVANNYYLNGVACWYGSSGNYLGYTEVIDGASSPGAAASATLKPMSGAAYFRLRIYQIWDASSNASSIQAQLDKSTMTKTVAAVSETYGWNSTGHAFVPADYEDRIVSLETVVNALKGDMSIFGIVDEQKQITLTGALEAGTYTISYQDAEGNTVDIGSFQIGG